MQVIVPTLIDGVPVNPDAVFAVVAVVAVVAVFAVVAKLAVVAKPATEAKLEVPVKVPLNSVAVTMPEATIPLLTRSSPNTVTPTPVVENFRALS